MPGFFSNIPVLSAIPNPLNLFTGDDDDSQHTPSRQSSTRSDDSKPAPILTRDNTVKAGRGNQLRKSSSTSVVISSEVDSDGPRSGRPSVMTGRDRGLSVTSGVSGVTTDSGGRRRKQRVETFVLVKPPPTAAKNPLNLQVQLVIPEKKTRPRRGSDAPTRAAVPSGDLSSGPSTPQRQSFENPRDADATPTAEHPPTGTASTLKRSNSVDSSQSSSGGLSATSTTSQSGKRIIPLYNLAVHNVMQPTIVTDAGTDSKVAKFGKRQLDIAGVGILEPAEVWLPFAGQPAGSPRPSVDAPRPRPTSMVSTTTSNLTPAVSRVDTSQRSSLENNALAPPEDGPKKFFGKIFKKRASAEPLAERRRGTLKTGSGLLNIASPSTLQVPSPASPIAPQVHFPSDAPASATLGHTTFGLAPSVLTRRLSETALDPSGAIVGITSDAPPSNDESVSLLRSARPVGYSWVVRKWSKKNMDGWAAHLVAAAAAGLDLVSGGLPGDGPDEVVFEWVKLRVSPNGPASEAMLKKHPAAEALETRRKRVVPVATPSPRPSPAGSRTSLALARQRTDAAKAENLTVDTGAAPKPKIFRRSSVSPAPVKTKEGTGSSKSSTKSPPTSGSGSPDSADNGRASPACDIIVDDDEDEYDSDPEDSETPWQCSVWVKRTGERQLLATLTPAPHHPKVIGVLRIPSVLRSISLADVKGSPTTPVSAGRPATVVGNFLSPTHMVAPPKSYASDDTATNQPKAHTEAVQRIREEVCLTEENLKDVVSVTAMWLVAREEFGGLGAGLKKKK